MLLDLLQRTSIEYGALKGRAGLGQDEVLCQLQILAVSLVL